MRFRGWVLGVLVAVMAAWALPACGQLAAYGAFTGADTGVANSPRIYGGTFGFYATKKLGMVAVGPDLRGSILRRGSSTSNADQALDLGLGGLRLAVTPHVLPLMPYVEVLGGIGYQRSGQGSAREDQFSGAAQLLAGVDWTVLPRLDWRVLEFSYGRLGGSIGVFNPETLSTGVVFRLP